eukprot:765314-Hanusia_phi.AAC.2
MRACVGLAKLVGRDEGTQAEGEEAGMFSVRYAMHHYEGDSAWIEGRLSERRRILGLAGSSGYDEA